jgi:hypothetical protein
MSRLLLLLLFALVAVLASAAAEEPITYIPDIPGATDTDIDAQTQCTTKCSMKSKGRKSTCETMCVKVPPPETQTDGL